MSFIYGRCRICGYIYDAAAMIETGCPACRAARVAKAFAPLDPLRTVLGIAGQRAKDALDWQQKKEEASAYWRGEHWGEPKQEEQTEVPEGCKMPMDEADQIYQLKRLFRK